VIRNYDPKNVRLTWGGIEFKFIDGTFIEVKAVPDRSRYPKDCPRCGAPAYIGASSVDCSARCH
jgi:hypothetical protein